VAARRTIAGVPLWAAGLVLAVAVVGWFAGGIVARRAVAARLPAPPPAGAVSAAVAVQIAEADADARRSPSAETVGRLGMTYHGGQRPAEATAAYLMAEALAPAEWRWTYLRGALLDERGDGSARGTFARVVESVPGHGLAWFHLGELAFKAGRLDEAQAAYAKARDAAADPPFAPPGVGSRQSTPLSAYARLGLARIALDRGDTAAAAGEVRAILERYPAFGPARALDRITGVGAAALGDATRRPFASPYVPPADPLVDAVVASSVDTDLLLKHAGLATRAGDAAWREFLVRRALAASPDDLNVLMEMATMLQAQGRPAEALEHLRRHEALAPADHHGLVEQGRCLIDLGRLSEAEAVLRRAAGVRDAAAEYNLGVALDRQDRWDEARQHYARALQIDPFHVRSMNNLGVGLDRHGETAPALALFERAIGIAPETGEFYVNYGVVLLRLNRFDDAVRVLGEAVALSPRDANAHNNLGIALARIGDLPRARDAFARALEIDPRHENARDNLAQVSQALAR
jgi:tetratricopeptide (TPR) repeat protein